MLGTAVFRSRVKLYANMPPLMRRTLLLSTLTKGGYPVNITNYAPEEQLVIDVPLTVIQRNNAGHAAIAENGLDTVVHVADQPIAVLKDYADLDALDLRFVAKGYVDDSALYDGLTLDAADDATIIEDSDRVIVVNQFDLHTDRLEIGQGRAFQLEDARDGRGTIVVVDGEPVFLVPGILPDQMAGALVQPAASA